MHNKFVVLYVLQGQPNFVTDADGEYPHVFGSLIEASNWLLEREKSLRLLSACECSWVINCDTGETEAF